MRRHLFLFALLAGFTSQAQLIHGWSIVRVDGQPAFQLQDSTLVHADRQARDYIVSKRVWVDSRDMIEGQLDSGATLYDAKLKPIGQVLGPLVLEDVQSAGDYRKMRHYRTAIVSGHVTTSAFVRNSIPERELEQLLGTRQRGNMSLILEAYFEKFGFEKLRGRQLPQAMNSNTVYVLRYTDQSNTDDQRFRMMVILRGGSFIQAVIHAEQEMEFPKVRIHEEASYGQVYYFVKPTTSVQEAVEELAYLYIPL